MDIKELKHKIALDSARIYTEYQCKNLTSNEKIARNETFIKMYNVFVLETYLKAYKSNLESLEIEDPQIENSGEVVKVWKEIEKIYKEDK